MQQLLSALCTNASETLTDYGTLLAPVVQYAVCKYAAVTMANRDEAYERNRASWDSIWQELAPGDEGGMKYGLSIA
jgi:hypothetical protein